MATNAQPFYARIDALAYRALKELSALSGVGMGTVVSAIVLDRLGLESPQSPAIKKAVRTYRKENGSADASVDQSFAEAAEVAGFHQPPF